MLRLSEEVGLGGSVYDQEGSWARLGVETFT